ncbi:hypothetical protein RDABS01_029554, partial [Bienertia sinuspersici]
DFARTHNKPCLLGGDFNGTRYDWERNSCCSKVQRRSLQFNHWIESMELVELEFSGPSHTWARGNSEETRCSARLDRALCNGEWGLRFSNAELGWRLLSEPATLWSRVVRGKYCHGRCDIDMFQPKQNCSNLWKGLVENAKFISEGAQTAVGNGKSTLFWDHKWATNKPLIDLAVKEVPQHCLGAIVEEMWCNTNGWKWDEFVKYLPLSVLKLIQSHELTPNEEVEDLLFWNGATSGGFTIKSVLKIIRQEDDQPNDDAWEWVWSAPAQNRVKFFLWLVMHDRILSNENRVKRGLSDDRSCPLCHHGYETTLHLLRDYDAAKQIWVKLLSTSQISTFFTGNNIKEWVKLNLMADNDSNLNSWPMTFALIDYMVGLEMA